MHTYPPTHLLLFLIVSYMHVRTLVHFPTGLEEIMASDIRYVIWSISWHDLCGINSCL